FLLEPPRLDPARVGRLAGLAEARFEARAPRHAGFGQPGAYVGDDARDVFETLAQEHAESLALALARRDHVVERRFEQVQRGLAQPFRIEFLAHQHTGPAEQVGEIGAERRKTPGDLRRGTLQLVEHRFVDADLAGAGIDRPEAQVHVDLAARQFRRRAFAQCRLDRAQFLGQAWIEFEV